MTDHLKATKLRTLIAINQQRECEFPECCRPRQKITRYCNAHARAWRQYGHPLAKPLDARMWRDKRLQVRQVFDGHPDHPGLVNMLAYLKQYLGAAGKSDTAFSGAREVGRLQRAGVSPLNFLIEACACWSHLSDNPRTVPDDRSAAWAVARAVLQLAARPRRPYRPSAKIPWREAGATYALKPRSSDIGAVSVHLRELLAPLVVNVQAALKQRDQQKVQALQALRQPFHAPTVALLAEEVNSKTSNQQTS
jgi:hypothetical protein